MAGGARRTDVIFEMAGCGTYPRLAQVGCPVIALTRPRIKPIVRAETAWALYVDIREGNVLDVDWQNLAHEAGQPLTVYGNLPII